MLADRPNSLVAADSASSASIAPTLYLPAYDIVHAIPGRFRLRIPQVNWDEDYATRLEWLCGNLPSVTEARVNGPAKSLIVSYDETTISPRKLQKQVVACLEDATNPELSTEITIADSPEDLGEIDYVERLGMPGLSLLLSIGAIAGLPIPIWLLAGVIVAGSVPAFLRAWEGIEEEGELNVDFLDSLAIVLHTIEGRFFPPAFMLGLLESGEVIRDLTARGTARANLDLLDCLGKTARVERDGETHEIPLKEVVPGDVVVVFPGDQIPIDGNILSGTATIDQQKLTGESVPVTRHEGEEVFASTLVVDGTIRIEVERTGENTRAGVVVALMKAAPVHDTRIENYAQKIGNQAVLPTLFLGGAVWAATGSAARGISLITLDFGTGIRVSVPTAILSALTYAARQGVFVRSGRAIEMLSRVDTIVFDKTGTLTQGHAEVVEVCSIDRKYSEADVLAIAATAEQGLTHPVAEAIVRHAEENGVGHRECEDWDYLVGFGISARIDQQPVYVGSGSLMRKKKIDLDALHREHPEILNGGNSMVYVSTDRQVIGAILYRDPPRPESHLVIADLHREGIEPYMLSGDVQPVAEAIAAELGIESHNVYAGAFPERKVEVVKGLSESGKTIAFVGDGINDSAALAHADVSISFASATDMARETADIVLMDDNIASLIMAIRVAKQTMDVVWQNTAVVAVPNLGAMLFGVFFILDPVLAVAINNGSAILAELNGLRPLLGPDNVPDFVKDPTIVQKTQKAIAPSEPAAEPTKSPPEPQPENGTAKGTRRNAKGFGKTGEPDEPATFEDLRVG